MAYELTEFDQSIIDCYEKARAIYRDSTIPNADVLPRIVEALTLYDVLEMIDVSCERRIENIRKWGASY